MYVNGTVDGTVNIYSGESIVNGDVKGTVNLYGKSAGGKNPDEYDKKVDQVNKSSAAAKPKKELKAPAPKTGGSGSKVASKAGAGKKTAGVPKRR